MMRVSCSGRGDSHEASEHQTERHNTNFTRAPSSPHLCTINFFNKGWKVLHIDDHMSDRRSGRLPLQGWSCPLKCAALRTQTHVCRPSPEQQPLCLLTHIIRFISSALTSGILWLFFFLPQVFGLSFLVCFKLHFFLSLSFSSAVFANLSSTGSTVWELITCKPKRMHTMHTDATHNKIRKGSLYIWFSTSPLLRFLSF